MLFLYKRLAVGFLILAGIFALRLREKSYRQKLFGLVSYKNSDFVFPVFFFVTGWNIASNYLSATQGQSNNFYVATIPSHISNATAAIFFALLIVAVYFLARFASRALIAGIPAAFLMTSPVLLYVLNASPQRDFTRGPIAIWSLVLVLTLTCKKISFRTFLELSFLLGGFLGIGCWNRTEFMFWIVPCIGSLMFLSSNLGPRSFGKKTIAACVLLISFFLFAPRPFFDQHAQHGVAGFTTFVDSRLGLTRPPYDVGYLFLDEYLDASHQLVSGHQWPKAPQKSFIERYVTNLPADFMTRIIGATKRVFELPFEFSLAPVGLTQPFIKEAYRLRGVLHELLVSIAAPVAFCTMIVLAGQSFRLFCLHLGWITFLCALATGQFLVRHYFYLGVISFWNLAFILNVIAAYISEKKTIQKNELLRGVFTCAAVACLIFSLLTALRSYQHHRLENIGREYAAAQTIPFEQNSMRNERDRGAIFGTYHGKAPKFLVAEISESCKGDPLWPVIRYEPIETEYLKRLDWSRTLRMDKPAGAKLYFPIWEGFQEFELPKHQRKCLKGIREVVGADTFDIILNAQFPLHKTYQEIRKRLGEKKYSNTSRPLKTETPQHEISPTDLKILSPIVSVLEKKVIIRGHPLFPTDQHMFIHKDRSRSTLNALWSADLNPSEIDTDLFVSKPIRMLAGEGMIIRGKLRSGAIKFGLLLQDENHGFTVVNQKGLFEVTLVADIDGTYTFGAASAISAYDIPEIQAEIREIFEAS